MTDLVATRTAFHALAEQVISPLRVQATGNEIALQPRPGGFGTPDLPGGGWVGVSGTDVVRVDAGGTEQREPITSLRAAAAFVGLDATPSDEPLAVDADAAGVLAETWVQGAEQLAALASDAQPDEDVSAIHLWPEHFDIAIELGEEAAGRRATYGVSPGDDGHPRPYAYVAPWLAPDPAPIWNATAFRGAETERLADAPDLWQACRARLAAPA
jgi:hypothetical protein